MDSVCIWQDVCYVYANLQTTLALRGVKFLRIAASGKIANGEGCLYRENTKIGGDHNFSTSMLVTPQKFEQLFVLTYQSTF